MPLRILRLPSLFPVLWSLLLGAGCLVDGDGTDPSLSEGAEEDTAQVTNALSVGSNDSQVFWQSTAGSTNEAGDQFGRALAAGDFDGDGYEDLAVGVPYEDQDGLTNVGMVVVFYGSSSGLDGGSWEKFTQNSVAGAANEDSDLFGYRLAAGDFDADGKDDLAVGVPYEDIGTTANSGAVMVFYGSNSGLSPSSTEVITQDSVPGCAVEANDYFGMALAVGDFDGDQHDDLAIGIPYEDTEGATSAGRLAVLFGASAGLLPADYQLINQGAIPGATSEDNDHFGYSLAAGDINHDGYDDLFAGVPDEDVGAVVDAGAVIGIKGSSTGLVSGTAKVYTQADVNSSSPETSDHFGYALAMADFNGDSYVDVAASAPYEDTGAAEAGLIAVLRGKSGSFNTSWSEAFTELSAYGEKEDYDRAGFALTAGDFDGDGYGDLAVGVPYEDEGVSDNGAVLAFFGGSGGILPARSYWFTQSSQGGLEEDYDRFGYTLAAGDFDGDGRESLATGAPYEDSGSTTDVGAVFVRTLDPGAPVVTAGAAIVIDRASGEVLGAKFPDERWAPASTTKMMTALLAIEAINAGTKSLGDTVTIQADVAVEGGGAIGLAPGDKISLRDLLYLALVSSENDAATAIGTYISGSRSAFVAQMNARASALGLTNTSYVDISGRDPEDIISGCSGNDFDNPACAHFSTARDLAALARFCLNDSLFRTFVGTTSWTTTTWKSSAGVDLDQTVSSTNYLIRSSKAEYYPGAYGVKTGTSDRAGSNLVSAAAVGGNDVIAVVLGSDDNGTATGDRFSDSATLLDFGL